MKIYVDLVLILNFLFDFILLFSNAVLLRRQTTLKKLLLAAFVGSLTIFAMFIELSSISLFFIKIFISILMILIAFGFEGINYFLKNLFYLYTSSIMLGGFLYFLNIQFSYKNEGLLFYFNGLSINFIVLIIISPLILYFYVKQGLLLKNYYSNCYLVDIYMKGGDVIEATAFLDTGNKLVDPYKKRPILLLNKKLFNVDYERDNILLVPYEALNYQGLLKCVIPDKIFIQGIGFKTNFLVGIANEEIKMEGIDCIIGENLIERG